MLRLNFDAMRITNVFYPMSKIPERDDSDKSFSKTVIVFNDKLNLIDFGYFDYEEMQWSHFGKNEFLLRCWCYIPDPKKNDACRKWDTIKPKGFKEGLF